MATATEPRTTIRQHVNGVVFLAGAILLAIAAFGLLIMVPFMLLVDGFAEWRRGALDFFLARRAGLIAVSTLAWMAAIAAAILMARSDRLNRAFDKSFRLSLSSGDGAAGAGGARAQDVAAHLLRETAARTVAFSFSDVLEEDYGAGFWASAGDDSFWVAVSALDEDVAKPQRRFVVSASYDSGMSLFKRLRHRPDESRFNELAGAVGAAVKALRPPRSRGA